MTIVANPGLADEFASAIAWWRDAGVDCLFEDAPRNWIAPPPEPESPRMAVQAEAPPRRALGPAPVAPSPLSGLPIPENLADFRDWWLNDPALDGGRKGGRVPPRGECGAKLMILVPEPEREDRDSLLSGPQGVLLAAMLSAFAIAPGQAYFASALPRHTPMTDWDAAGAQGIGRILSHHVALARPERLIAFGGNILPLLGNDPAQGPAVLRQFNHEGCNIPLLAAWDLRAIAGCARDKALIWRTWLDWTA